MTVAGLRPPEQRICVRHLDLLSSLPHSRFWSRASKDAHNLETRAALARWRRAAVDASGGPLDGRADGVRLHRHLFAAGAQVCDLDRRGRRRARGRPSLGRRERRVAPADPRGLPRDHARRGLPPRRAERARGRRRRRPARRARRGDKRGGRRRGGVGVVVVVVRPALRHGQVLPDDDGRVLPLLRLFVRKHPHRRVDRPSAAVRVFAPAGAQRDAELRVRLGLPLVARAQCAAAPVDLALGRRGVLRQPGDRHRARHGRRRRRAALDAQLRDDDVVSDG